MIAYQKYNTKSPLKGLAARWAAEHPKFLPIDPRELLPPLVEKSEVPDSGSWPERIVVKQPKQ